MGSNKRPDKRHPGGDPLLGGSRKTPQSPKRNQSTRGSRLDLSSTASTASGSGYDNTRASGSSTYDQQDIRGRSPERPFRPPEQKIPKTVKKYTNKRYRPNEKITDVDESSPAPQERELGPRDSFGYYKYHKPGVDDPKYRSSQYRYEDPKYS